VVGDQARAAAGVALVEGCWGGRGMLVCVGLRGWLWGGEVVVLSGRGGDLGQVRVRGIFGENDVVEECVWQRQRSLDGPLLIAFRKQPAWPPQTQH
jgi:hypothetical protein